MTVAMNDSNIGAMRAASSGAAAVAGTRALQLENVHAFYGKSHVLHGVTMEVRPGEIVSLLGRNGSGRSTTVKTIMGQVDGTGSIAWGGEALLGRKAYEIAQRGSGDVRGNRGVFP